MTAAEAVKVIGRVGDLSIPGLPWPVPVLVQDVRTVYGRTDFLVSDYDWSGDRAASTSVTVWVEAGRVTFETIDGEEVS